MERLQQGRIRGLLLDEVKERNKALDRLLGMETAEVFLEHLKKKGFQDAAEAWREHSRQTHGVIKSRSTV